MNLNEVNLSSLSAVVIGSGPAGTAVATRLAEAGQEVLILEAGDISHSAIDQAQIAKMDGVGDFDGKYWPKHWAIGLGGTSARWAGWCMSLDNRDFDKWPIGLGDLHSHYRDAAAFFGRSERIIGYSRPLLPNFDFRPFSTEAPLRLNAEFYNKPYNKRIKVAKKTVVVGFEFSDNGSLLTGLRVLHSGDEVLLSISPKQVVVLAAGGIGNAQLLLQPNKNNNQRLKKRLPRIGQFLSEHPHCYNAGLMITHSLLDLSVPDFFGRFASAVAPNNKLYAECGRLGFTIQFSSKEVPKDFPKLDFLGDKPPAAYNLNVRAEMSCLSTNRVELGPKNEYGLHMPVAYCAVSSNDKMNYDKYLRKLAMQVFSDSFGVVRIDNDRIFKRFTGGGHTMCTTRMSNSSKSGVVNTDCFVHGIDNFAVAGSSVFSSGGAANPTMTIVALAYRLADFILDKQK